MGRRERRQRGLPQCGGKVRAISQPYSRLVSAGLSFFSLYLLVLFFIIIIICHPTIAGDKTWRYLHYLGGVSFELLLLLFFVFSWYFIFTARMFGIDEKILVRLFLQVFLRAPCCVLKPQVASKTHLPFYPVSCGAITREPLVAMVGHIIDDT